MYTTHSRQQSPTRSRSNSTSSQRKDQPKPGEGNQSKHRDLTQEGKSASRSEETEMSKTAKGEQEAITQTPSAHVAEENVSQMKGLEVESASTPEETEVSKTAKGKQKATTETPSTQVAEENDFSQMRLEFDKKLGQSFVAYWKELNLLGKTDNEKCDLPHDHKIFKLIESTMNNAIKEKPYTSDKQEATRMAHAKKVLKDAEEKLKDKQLKDEDKNKLEQKKRKAQLRLIEGEKGGANRVTSGEIKITKILVLYNKKLLDNYSSRANVIKKELNDANDKNPLKKVDFSTKPEPVIDQSIGEVLLLHGTSSDTINKIEQTGFDPSRGLNKGTKEKPQYGLLGQGTYFSDNISKVMTYATCPECEDYQCEDHDKDSELIVSRVLLGHPQKKHGFAQPLPSENLRTQSYQHPLKEGRHSVYSKGWQISKNPFSAGSGTNEFLIKNGNQVYPELRIFYQRKNNSANNTGNNRNEAENQT